MTKYLAHIDWRVVWLAIIGYYVLPSLLAGKLIESIMDDTFVPAYIGRPIASFFAFFYLFLPPLLSGDFSARFSRKLPYFNAMVLTVCGMLFSAFYLTTTLPMYIDYALLCLALAMLGVQMHAKRTQ